MCPLRPTYRTTQWSSNRSAVCTTIMPTHRPTIKSTNNTTNWATQWSSNRSAVYTTIMPTHRPTIKSTNDTTNRATDWTTYFTTEFLSYFCTQ